MHTNEVFMIFLGMIVILGVIAYFIAQFKANSIRSNGNSMHSQPGQYGWLAALYSGLPVLFIGILGGIINISGVNVPLEFIMAIAALLGIAGLLWGYLKVKPETKARDSVERVIKSVLLFSAVVSILTTIGILVSIIFEAIRFFKLVPISEFLFSAKWDIEDAVHAAQGNMEAGEVDATFGAVPFFAATFVITFIAMLIAIPVGLSAAIYLAEYASHNVRNMAKPILEVLAGIPTVVYGFFAALVIAPLFASLATVVGIDVSSHSESALAAGVIMGIMIIPFISSLSDDVISAVPDAMRQGALGLGLTKGEMIKDIVLPAAMPGIISASLLGISRALGETMIVVMAAGMVANLSANPLEPMATVTVQIVASLTGDQEFDNPLTLAAFAFGLVLFVVTLVINMISVQIIHHYQEKYRVSNL